MVQNEAEEKIRRSGQNWADKYQKSDHHLDRLMRTVIGYEDNSCLRHPEYSENLWPKYNLADVGGLTRNRSASVHPLYGEQEANVVSSVYERAKREASVSRLAKQNWSNVESEIANARSQRTKSVGPVLQGRSPRSRSRSPNRVVKVVISNQDDDELERTGQITIVARKYCLCLNLRIRLYLMMHVWYYRRMVL